MVLEERLQSTNISKVEGVVPYLTRLTHIKDELGAIGSKIDDEDLVWKALNGFSNEQTVKMHRHLCQRCCG